MNTYILIVHLLIGEHVHTLRLPQPDEQTCIAAAAQAPTLIPYSGSRFLNAECTARKESKK